MIYWYRNVETYKMILFQFSFYYLRTSTKINDSMKSQSQTIFSFCEPAEVESISGFLIEPSNNPIKLFLRPLQKWIELRLYLVSFFKLTIGLACYIYIIFGMKLALEENWLWQIFGFWFCLNVSNQKGQNGLAIPWCAKLCIEAYT